MNAIGKLIVCWIVATMLGLFAQLVPGVPPIGFTLFVIGGIPVSVGIFFIRFK